jgi:hypothetical protein
MKNSYPNTVKKIGGTFTRISRLLGICAACFVMTPAFSATPAPGPSLGSAMSPDGKTRVDILSLKHTEGDTVTLRFQITNDGNDTYGMTAANARLIDMAGRRIYSPGVATNSCSVAAGERLACYAVFGAPPAGTTKMAVQFYEKLDVIMGIPLSEQ